MIQLVLLQLQSMLHSCSLHTKSKKTNKKNKQNITFAMLGGRVQEISVSYLMFSSILNKL